MTTELTETIYIADSNPAAVRCDLTSALDGATKSVLIHEYKRVRSFEAKMTPEITVEVGVSCK